MLGSVEIELIELGVSKAVLRLLLSNGASTARNFQSNKKDLSAI